MNMILTADAAHAHGRSRAAPSPRRPAGGGRPRPHRRLVALLRLAVRLLVPPPVR